MLLSSPITSFCKDHVLFLAYPFNRSVVSSFQVLFILSSLASLFNRSAVRICSPLFLVYLVPIRAGSIPSCPLYSSFIALQPPRFTCCSLFLFSNGVFSTSFISAVFFSWNGLTFSRFFGFTRLSKKQLSFTSHLPLPFFPSGAILDLGTRSSRSGGVW